MIVITSANTFNKMIASEQLVVVDFTAIWCPPCKAIAPKFKEFSEKYTDAIFLKVDINENEDIAEQYKITAVPAFQFYKNSILLDEFKGANPIKLESLIKKHI